jgi:16S rRNA (adenine1518-N6/adenine1519-N6)-dimethyltransferase
VRGPVLERIAAAACGEREELVIEIGPGKGALTEKLLERADRVVAIEVDPAMVEHLRQRFAGEARLEIVQNDVLETDLNRWGPAAVAGNLPYYITSPIVRRVLAMSPAPNRVVLLMQKEVAERLAARPGTRDFGLLTTETALFADVKLLFEVKPGSFQPPPKVDSALVLLTPHPRAAELGLGDVDGFIEFLGRCFRQKRKMLRNNLAPFYGKAQIDSRPEASLRAEQTSLESLAQLYQALVH